MKKRMIRLFILLMSLQLLWAASPKQDFQKYFNAGLEAFKKQHYITATTQFKKAEQTGIYSGALYLNLGTTLAQRNNNLEAFYYLQKARKYIPGAPTLIQNINFLQGSFKDTTELTPSWIHIIFDRIFWTFSLNTLLWSGIILLTFTTLFLAVKFWIPAPSKKATLIFIIILWGVYGILSWPRFQALYKPNKVMIFQERLEVKSGPTTDFTTLFTIHEGLIVTVEKQTNDWAFIRVNKKLSGWIPVKSYQTI